MTDTKLIREKFSTVLHPERGFTHSEEWGADFDAWLAAHDAEVAARALREFGDALQAVPDHAPSPYDQGRVDQRHLAAAEAFERADQIETETKEQGS